MSRVKVRHIPEFREITYNEEHWNLLRKLREQALKIMKILNDRGIETWLHGSVARGDVWVKSDVDIVIPRKIPSYLVELSLEESGVKPYARYLVAATPVTTLKAYISLNEEETLTVSFPLFEFKPREIEFYKYGGVLSYKELLENKRVPGVNKNLVLIVPTMKGHLEAPVIGYEEYVAKLLGVSIDVVRERIDVLTKRDEVGRTGIFAKLTLAPGESFEEALERLLKERPLLRRVYSRLI